MKTTIITYLLLFNFILFGQTGEVLYVKSLNIQQGSKQDKDKVFKMNSDLKDLEYTLKFDAIKSLFQLNNLLENDFGNNRKSAIRLGGGKGIYYTESKKKSIHNVDYFGIKYNVDYTYIHKTLEWSTKTDTKTIEGHKCYLAESVRQIENPDGVFYQQIKAWYCPEINYSFGPIGYYGLPGLILELQIDNVTYKAIRIKIDDSRKKLNIAMPKAEKIVSYNEYLNISKELYKKMTRKN